MTTATTNLAQELHDATAMAHQHAENSTFIADLIAGKRSAADFIRLQEQAWLFYTALEAATARVRATTVDPVVRDLLDERLARVAYLEQDLNVLHGTEAWKSRVVALPATERYIRRLEALESPAALIAHHYVRYLGDLSGGQVIATMMRRHYDIPAEALSFYDFTELGKLKPYKDRYRALLNELRFDADARATALSEAEEAFVLNSLVFADLC